MRLSELQARIIGVLANHIVNTGDDGWPRGFMTYRELLASCAPHWGIEHWDVNTIKKRRTAKVSLSRSLRSLYDKGLVTGVALAWVIKSKEDWGESEDIIAWQGGGRKKRYEDSSVTWDVPRFKMWSLSDAGMVLAGIREEDERQETT